jgi:hypothetical protein
MWMAASSRDLALDAVFRAGRAAQIWLALLEIKRNPGYWQFTAPASPVSQRFD